MVEKLHPRSHILPAFLVKDLFGTEKKALILSGKGERKTTQSGLYESIVCNECETSFGPYDKFFANCFRDKSIQFNIENRQYKEFDLELWSNFNYERISNFCYSVILRAELFHKRSNLETLLGVKHFRTLADIFFKEDSMFSDYPIILRRLYSNNGLDSVIQFPFKHKIDGHNVVKWAALGVEFSVFVSSHKKPAWVEGMSLKPNNTCYVIKENFDNSNTLIRFAREHHKNLDTIIRNKK